MDRPDRRLHFVCFAAKVVIIPPPEYAKEEESRTTITQLENPDDEEEDVRVRRGLQQQLEVKKRKSVDDIAILLAILCSTPVCFITAVFAWAANNPRDMCKNAPQLALFSIVYQPHCSRSCPASRLVWFWDALLKTTDRMNIDSKENRTKLRLILTMVLVALSTILIMPWTWNVETWVLQVDCSA